MHCGNETTGKYCSICSTAEKRKQVDEANNALWLEKFNKPYICKVCSGEIPHYGYTNQRNANL